MNKWKKINKSRLYKIGLLTLAAAFVVFVVGNAALAVSTEGNNPTYDLYWEQTVEYNWELVKNASIDEVELDRDEDVEIDYSLQVNRAAEVTDLFGVKGDTGKYKTVQIFYGDEKLAEVTGKPNSDYELQFTPIEGVTSYTIKFSSQSVHTMEDTINFEAPTKREVFGIAVAKLTDSFTFPDDSGLTFTQDPAPPDSWTLGEDDGEDFSEDIEYTLTIANEQADYEAEFSVENTAVLTPQSPTRAIENPNLASASATVKIFTAAEPVDDPGDDPGEDPGEDPGDDPGEDPEDEEKLPKTGTDFGMFSILGSALVTMGLALLRRR